MQLSVIYTVTAVAIQTVPLAERGFQHCHLFAVKAGERDIVSLNLVYFQKPAFQRHVIAVGFSPEMVGSAMVESVEGLAPTRRVASLISTQSHRTES